MNVAPSEDATAGDIDESDESDSSLADDEETAESEASSTVDEETAESEASSTVDEETAESEASSTVDEETAESEASSTVDEETAESEASSTVDEETAESEASSTVDEETAESEESTVENEETLAGEMPNSSAFDMADFDQDELSFWGPTAYGNSTDVDHDDVAYSVYDDGNGIVVTDAYEMTDDLYYPYDSFVLVVHVRNDSDEVRCDIEVPANVRDENNNVILTGVVDGFTGAFGTWGDEDFPSQDFACLPPGGTAYAWLTEDGFAPQYAAWPDDDDRNYLLAPTSVAGSLTSSGNLTIVSIVPDDGPWYIDVINDGDAPVVAQSGAMFFFDDDGRIVGGRSFYPPTESPTLYPTDALSLTTNSEVRNEAATLVVQLYYK